MERKQIALAAEERAELKRINKVGAHGVRLANRTRIDNTCPWHARKQKSAEAGRHSRASRGEPTDRRQRKEWFSGIARHLAVFTAEAAGDAAGAAENNGGTGSPHHRASVRQGAKRLRPVDAAAFS